MLVILCSGRFIWTRTLFSPISPWAISRNAGKTDEAAKHFSNVSKLLALLPPNNLLPESDGLTAGRLAETILALTSREIAK